MRQHPLRRYVRSAVTILLVASLAGCSGSPLTFLNPFVPELGEVKRAAPETAVYKIKVARQGTDEDDLHTLGGSRRFLRKGQPIGFASDADGRVLAVAGDEQFPLRVKAGDQFYVWAYQPDQPDAAVEDERARRTEGFLQSAFNLTILIGAIVGLVWTFPEWLPELFSDCDQ